jgi:tripartite ATP-independent transporter DctM subunit
MTTAALSLFLLALVLLDAPLFLLLAGLAAALFFASSGDLTALQTVIIEINRLASMPILVALPLFALTGNILARSQAPARTAQLIHALTAGLPGNAAIAGLLTCALFTALTGASGVTIVALGGLLYPMLRDAGYPETFTLGLITTGGSLGLLFPPSLPVILYGVVAQVDIAAIYRAALLPGLLLVICLALYALGHRLRHRRATHPAPPPADMSVSRALRRSMADWPVLGIILVGVYGGMVTISEVAVLVLAYVLLVTCLLRREVDFLRQLPAIVVESAMLTGALVVILGAALALTAYLVEAQVPARLLEWLTAWTQERWLFLAGLNVVLLAAGCLMDIFSATVILVPVIAPIAQRYGVDPLHLCVIFLINLEIGYSTPPIGMNLFIASLKFDTPVTTLYRASAPFLVVMLAVLLAVIFLPHLSLLSPLAPSP